MLEYLDRICRENEIEYSLAGGTLLGSIRHKGFIPWDDDIDIVLTRSNYEKLMQLLMETSKDKYSLLYYKKTPTFISFARLIHNNTFAVSKYNKSSLLSGVWLDIFPIDSLPDDKVARDKQRDEIKKYSKYLRASIKGGLKYASFPTLTGFLAKVFLFLPWHIKYYGKDKELSQQMEQIMTRYNHQRTKEVGFVDSIYFEKEHFPAEIFEEYEDIEFENLTVRKIKNHDTYLTQLFGDYMKLPPKEEREGHVIYDWYWE